MTTPRPHYRTALTAVYNPLQPRGHFSTTTAMKSSYSVSVLLAAVAGVALVSGQVPIPRREVGFVYGSGPANASVHLDF